MPYSTGQRGPFNGTHHHDRRRQSHDSGRPDLEYVSSAGLRVLVMTQKLAARRGGTLTLLNTTDDVQEVLEMTGLADVFDIKR